MSRTRSPSTLLLIPIIFVAILIRVVLIHLDYPPNLTSSIHFVSPPTSLRRLRDVIFLRKHALSAEYPDPGISSAGCYHPILLVRFFQFLEDLSESKLVTRYFFVLCDVIMGFLLWVVSQQYSLRVRSQKDSWLSLLVVGLFLLNPLGVLSCVAGSLAILTHICVIVSLICVGSSSGSWDAVSAVCLALATYLSVYPLVFVLFVAWFVASRSWKRLFRFGLVFLEMTVLLVGVSSWVNSSWDFFGVYANWFQVIDLTPNWGLFWYFLTECFPSFRLIFLIVFHAHVLCYPVPLALRFRDDPAFCMVLLFVITSTFGAYPGLGDHALGYCLLAVVQQSLAQYLKYPFLCTAAILLTLVSGPVFYTSWIEHGTGNVNFFFFVMLVFVSANFILVLDFVGAKIRTRDFRKLMQRMSAKPLNEKKGE